VSGWLKGAFHRIACGRDEGAGLFGHGNKLFCAGADHGAGTLNPQGFGTVRRCWGLRGHQLSSCGERPPPKRGSAGDHHPPDGLSLLLRPVRVERAPPQTLRPRESSPPEVVLLYRHRTYGICASARSRASFFGPQEVGCGGEGFGAGPLVGGSATLAEGLHGRFRRCCRPYGRGRASRASRNQLGAGLAREAGFPG